MKKIIITIDGHSACGKSTLAKALATELNYGYIDTGAMYRAVTFYFLENRVNIQKTAEMEKALKRINITFKSTVGGNRTYLNGKDVEDVIRKMFVSKNVSHVAAISTVRKMVVKQQVEMGKLKGIVMEGRDIGTVVFPNAELKIFLTANEDIRTKRRYDELIKKGQKVSMKSIKDNLLERDHIDSTRKDSPLKQAKEAVLIDNSNITPKEQLAMIFALSKERIKRLSAAEKKIEATKSKATPQKRTIQPTSRKQKISQKNTRQNQTDKKVVAQNTITTPQKKSSQTGTRIQKTEQKNPQRNQSTQKRAKQNTKTTPQKRVSQPTSKKQKTEQKSIQQNQSTQKRVIQNTKTTPQKRVSQPTSKKQKTEQKSIEQNQSTQKRAIQNTKTTPQKRGSQPISKKQKTEQKNIQQNQSTQKRVIQNTKTTPQKRGSQPTSKKQKTEQKNPRQNQQTQTNSENKISAQQEFLKIKPEEKTADRKPKPTPKRKTKQPVKKEIQKKSKPTPKAKQSTKKVAPKVKITEQETLQQKPTTVSSTQPKQKKVRTKRENKS